MTNTPNEGESSGQIRDEIRRTRAEMDQTVDTLAERLRPRHLVDDLVEMFRGKAHSIAGGSAATTGGGSAVDEAKEYGSAIVGKLKNHPVPAALIGAGLAWLLFDKASGDGGGSSASAGGGYRSGPRRAPGLWRDEDLRVRGESVVDARTGLPYDDSYGAEYRAESRAAMAGSSAGASTGESGGPGMMEKAKDAASRVGEKISDAAGSVKDSITGAASSAKESLSGAASGTASAASDYRRRAGQWTGSAYGSARAGTRSAYYRSRRTVEDSLNEYPLAAAGAALAAGVLAGLLLPGTQVEDRLMGERSEQLKDQAKSAGRDALERGKQVASDTANAAAGEAQRQGLTPETLIDKAKRVAHDVAETAKDSARREGLDDLGGKVKTVAQHGRDVAQDEAKRHKDELKPS